MISNTFRNVSWNGRIAYAIMCAIKYLSTKYPHKNWTPLFEKLWNATGEMFLDEWSKRIIDILPDCFFEFPSFEKSDFNYLTKSEYEIFKDLYNGLDEDFATLIEAIHSMEEIYAFTNIPGYGEESLKILEDIASMLEKENIPLPDPKLVEFSKFSEKNGWGEPFDGTKLSIILNK